ncbi:LysR family transcriptional regulator [Burkholderia gladioli]|uniref:LysR family transcriptional regulator n=1 Tax=Burkholderia gladioli TaxID=28095 RepID=UPI0016420422|nr:LysR family transcriptional regulator [Burkholderia gladioli]
MNFSNDSIELFLAVIDSGSFSAAARSLGKVPSAVSMAIANLEAELGYALFDRGRREPVPTAMGAALVPHARLALEQFRRLRMHALQLSQGLESRLSIAVATDIDKRPLLAAVGELSDRHPLLEIEILTAPQDDTRQLLHGRRVDLCIAYAGLAVDVREHFQYVGSERLTACIGPRHPQLKAGGDTFLEDLVQVRQILVASRDLPLADSRPLVGQSCWRTDSLAMAIEMVESGLGWGNFPLSAIAPLLRDGRLQRLQFKNIENGLSMPVHAVWLRERPLQQGAAALVGTLGEMAKQL